MVIFYNHQTQRSNIAISTIISGMIFSANFKEIRFQGTDET